MSKNITLATLSMWLLIATCKTNISTIRCFSNIHFNLYNVTHNQTRVWKNMYKQKEKNTQKSNTIPVSSLLFVCCRDEEGIHSGLFVMADLDKEFRDAETYVVQKPKERVIICAVWWKTNVNTYNFSIHCVRICGWMKVIVHPPKKNSVIIYSLWKPVYESFLWNFLSGLFN